MICWITIGLKNRSVLCFSFSEIKFILKAEWIHTGQCWCSGSRVYVSPSSVLLSCFQLGQSCFFFTFLVSCMMLYFYYGRKTVLITHRCFSSCWAVAAQNQEHYGFSYCPASEELGGTRSWVGAEPGQLSYAGQRDIPYHLASCKNKQTNKQKTTIYKEKNKPENCGELVWWAAAAWELAGHRWVVSN